MKNVIKNQKGGATRFTARTTILLVIVFFIVGSNRALLAQSQGAINLKNGAAGSDFYVRLQWTNNINSWMTCVFFTTYSTSIYQNGRIIPGYIRKEGKLANTGSIQLRQGINETNQWKMTYYAESGPCLKWRTSSNVSMTTVKLKPPTGFQATDSLSPAALKKMIVLTWNSVTDVPAALHSYLIYRDGDFSSPVATVGGGKGAMAWQDTGLTPGERHTYSIHTWVDDAEYGTHSSDTLEVTGSTYPGLHASDGEFSDYIEVTWPEMDESVQSARIYRDDLELEVWDPSEPKTIQDQNTIPGFKYNYTIKYYSGETGDGNLLATFTDTGYAKADGRITGSVQAPFGGPVIGAIVYAARTTDNLVQGEEQESIYSDTTDSNGEFVISDIYYHIEAGFNVYAKKGDHKFDPANRNVVLTQGVPVQSLVRPTFTDTTSVTVSGRIVQNMGEQQVNMAGVEILVNGKFHGSKTDAQGEYILTVEEPGNYTFTPKFSDHTFFPAERSVLVSDHVTDISFEDTEKNQFSGSLVGGCNIYIGKATFRIYNTENPAGGINLLVETAEGSGSFSIALPARKYNVEVQSFLPAEGFTETEIMEFFNVPEEIDLTIDSVEKHFVYRKAPEMEVTGFPASAQCAEPFNVPILEQLGRYALEIKVFESLGDQSCLTSSGYVVIYDEIRNGDGQGDTLMLENGSVVYEFLAGTPNIVGGGEHPYQKKIAIHANVDGQTTEYEQYVLVEGNRPREQTFSTVSPEVPFLILRDPPGDESYSFLSENTTFTSSLMFFTQQSSSLNVWGETKLGIEQEAGFGVIIPYKVWGQVKSSMEIGASLKSQTQFGLQFSVQNKFSTSGNQDITGSDGDVFIGSALNIQYALTDVISFENCQVVMDQEIVMDTEGFATTFIYTENHVADVLIPQLEDIAQIYQDKGSDSAVIYQDQIEVWQQTLAANTKLKDDAILIENKSFSAGAGFESSATVTTSASLSLEFNLYIETTVATEAGLEIGGIGGSVGADIKCRMELGGSASAGVTHEKTVGYSLNDDDLGDFFSVDIKGDLVYGTPVFELVSGRSSCPWEPGTQPREGVQLLVDKKAQYDVEEDAVATFKLNLGNITQSDEDLLYNLVFLQESNPEGAVLTLGGSEVQGGILTPYNIPAGGSLDVTVTVAKGPQSNVYRDLKFTLLSGCGDALIADTVSFSVFFQDDCSPMTVSNPLNNWLINRNDDNTFPVEISGYDKAKLNQVVLEYRNLEGSVWESTVLSAREDLGDELTIIDWDVAALDDGEYEIRMRTECGTEGSEFSFSNVVTGTIDRSAPSLFGVPEPTSGRYSTGDEISATFDESLNCFNVSADNVIVKDSDSGTIYSAGVGCSGNKIVIVPLTEATFQNQVVEISLQDIEDLYGNVTDEMITWKFDIADANFKIDADTDSDGDGIVNSDDSCPFASNPDQADLNANGIGDACDEDTDGDGVMSNVDNCPYAPNADQEDANGNTIGDVCDDDLDRDGDGIRDGEDNCPEVANSLQEDANADGEGDACHVVTGLGDEANGGRRLQLYPNPARDQINISFELERTSRVTVNILDLTSKIIQPVLDESLTYGKYTRSFNVQQLRNGLYIIQIDRNGRTESKKLFIQK